VVDVFQTADLIRSDLIILARPGLKVTDVKYSGDTAYHDTIYYEVPEYVIGYFADFSPLVGSMVMEGQGRPYFVASKISDLVSLFEGATEQDILKSLINYQGANPQGKKISLGGEKYVISQKPRQDDFLIGGRIISGVSCGQYGFYEKFRFKLAGNRRLLCGNRNTKMELSSLCQIIE